MTEQATIDKERIAEEPFVTISETALDQISAVVKQQERTDLFLRLFVQSSAGGISFGMALDTRRSDDDHVCIYEGVEVAIDRISYPYMENANVDFVQSEGKSGFQVTSPNSHLLASGAACGGCSGDAGCC